MYDPVLDSSGNAGNGAGTRGNTVPHHLPRVTFLYMQQCQNKVVVVVIIIIIIIIVVVVVIVIIVIIVIIKVLL